MSTFPDLMFGATDGVFAIGAGQTVLFWNRACENITGIPANQAVGNCCHEVMKGHDPQGRPLCKSDCPLGSLAKGGPPPSTLPMRITHQDGQKIQLCVGTMLMPSPAMDQWTVVHILRRGRDSRSADFFACNNSLRGETQDQQEFRAPTNPETDGAALLTSREREVLRLLADGGNADTLANQLHISSTTVRNHLQRLMAKLGVHSRLEAVAFAHRHNLACPPKSYQPNS